MPTEGDEKVRAADRAKALAAIKCECGHDRVDHLIDVACCGGDRILPDGTRNSWRQCECRLSADDVLVACAPDSAAGIAILRGGEVIPYEEPRLTEELAGVDLLLAAECFHELDPPDEVHCVWCAARVIIRRLAPPGDEEG